MVWQAIVRTGPHGAAVRYALPLLDGTAEITADHTTVPLPAGSRNWVLDYQTWYETPRHGVDTADLAEGDYGLPFLTRLDQAAHLLITESGIDGRFAGAHLRWDGALRFTRAASHPAYQAMLEIGRAQRTIFVAR